MKGNWKEMWIHLGWLVSNFSKINYSLHEVPRKFAICYQESIKETKLTISIIMFVCYLVAQDFLNHGKRTLRKYVLSRYLIFNLPPCSSLFVLEHLPPPPAPPPPHIPAKVCSFWLVITLFPSISMLLKFRENKLIVSTSIFGWT